jgi:hypothetical protein
LDSESKQESVSLAPEEIAFFAECEKIAQDVQLQAKGALCLIIRQRGLDGNWSVNGGALVRAT